MTNKMGQPIASLTNPDTCGTAGFFVCLSGPDPDCSSAGAETFLLTNRHVVCEDDNEMDIMHPLSSASPPSEPIRVVQPGRRRLDDLMVDLDIEISQRIDFISDVESDSDNPPDENDLLYAQYKRELPSLEALREHCLAHESLESQVIGTVAYSPALGVNNDFHNDWALIRCGSDFGAGTDAYNNSSCISGITNIVRRDLMGQVDPQFAVNVNGECKRRRAELEFITLNTVFNRSTVEHHYAIPEVNGVDAVIAQLEDEDEGKGDQGMDGKFLVYKYGAKTGSTHGILNCIMSFQWDGCSVFRKDYCIVGPHTRFSQPGDSGSAVFGLLPLSPPNPAANGREGAERGGYGHSSPQAAVEEDTKPRAHCTPGIIGLAWGGVRTRQSKGDHDLTFATPFDVILADIEKFTGRVAIGITRR